MIGSFRARGVEGLCVFAHEWLGIHFTAASSAFKFALALAYWQILHCRHAVYMAKLYKIGNV